jgi:hypothetical protein
MKEVAKVCGVSQDSPEQKARIRFTNGIVHSLGEN